MWLQVMGWGGSALLVCSLLQTRVLRFRILNLIASFTLTLFNGFLHIWPMVAMNTVLCSINVWFIAKLLRDRHNESAFEVLEVQPDDAYLRHVLRVHNDSILASQPDFHGPLPHSAAYLIEKGDETVGVVLMSTADGTAYVQLDYVTPRYRDFSPGEFVWRQSGLLRELGITKVISPPHMVNAYYERVGFTRDGESWVLDLSGEAST